MNDFNENDIPVSIREQLDKTVGAVEEDSAQEQYQPMYRIYGENKIPISKAESKLWGIRKSQARKVMEDVTTQWDITYRYYNADQVNIKDDGSVEYKNSKLRNNKVNSENLVWANNTGLIPALYSQDPSVEITTYKDKEEDINKKVTMIERLVNVLFKKRTSPGLNLKSKARKAILNALLTNRGVVKIGWNFKVDINENAINDYNKIAEELQEAKNVKEIKKLEGKLQALDEVLNNTQLSGPYLKHIRPIDLLIDPNANDQDGTDANWMMEREWIPTEYLKAKFGIDNENKDTTESIYKPGKVLPLNDNGTTDEEVNEFTLSEEQQSYESYGYDNIDEYKKSCLTECYWVWDKIKRRVLLYSNNCWDYPIWVWQDPYNLDEFFPYYILNFHESPNSSLCKGETSYYLDQQDTINKINSQLQKMREFGFDHYLFDTNSGAKINDIQQWANGKQKIVGIDLPPNKKFEDILFTGQVPYDKNQTLYDKTDLLRVVDMISGTDAITRSGEYKTNTTNLAIQSYIAGKSMRLDDKRDLIENWLGNVGWGIAQLCLMYMSQEQVVQLIGRGNADLWQNYTQDEIITTFSLQCVGGSTVKPTSDAKKQQAVQIAQILGQFAGATPYVTIIMLKILERAFDEVVVKEEDISIIMNSILQQLQAQQMMQEQQAKLAQAEANEAQTNADKNAVEAANIMAAQNGIPADQQVNTPNELLGR